MTDTSPIPMLYMASAAVGHADHVGPDGVTSGVALAVTATSGTRLVIIIDPPAARDLGVELVNASDL